MSIEPTRGQSVIRTIASENFQTKLMQALPPTVSRERFTSAAITAIRKNPAILEGEPNSLYSAIVESATVGLMCDGKQAALILYNVNTARKGQPPQWIKKVQFQPMVGGIILNLGRVGATVNAEVVYANDEFDYQLGDEPYIRHKPTKLGSKRGEMIGCYAIIKWGDSVYREVMDADDVAAVRAQSKQPDSLMWKEFPSEGWSKAVLRRCAKSVPLVDEVVAKTLNADDKGFKFEDEDLPAGDPAAVVSEVPAGKKRPRALQAVLEQTTPSTVESQIVTPEPTEVNPPPPKEEEDLF